VHDRQSWIVADDAGDVTAEYLAIADEYQFERGVARQRPVSRANDDFGAEVAAHRVQGDDRVFRHNIPRRPPAARRVRFVYSSS
jgi:hypothetical protein